MGSIIPKSEWEYILGGLEPATEYTLQVVLTVQGTEPIQSQTFTYTTMEEGKEFFFLTQPLLQWCCTSFSKTLTMLMMFFTQRLNIRPIETQ